MNRAGQADGIGRRIAEAREAAGLTQRQMAKALGQAERTIQAWERNERHPRPPAFRRLAELLEREPAWFYLEDDEAVAA